MREGAYDYLAKPFALGQLEVVITRIKDRMALEEENRELSRRVVGHETQSAGGDLTWRVQAIEERLAHIRGLVEGPCLTSWFCTESSSRSVMYEGSRTSRVKMTPPSVPPLISAVMSAPAEKR